MIIKPPINNAPFSSPTSVNVRVQASDRWWINNAGMDANFAVEAILARRRGDVMQFVNGSRQMCALGGPNYQRTFRDWGDLRADFSYNTGQEVLRIVVVPENVATLSSGSSQSFGGLFKIDIPFSGFPIPGMGDGAGSTYPTEFNWFGPSYPFDFAQVPCDPGTQSRYDQTDKVYIAQSPSSTPDLDGVGNATNIFSSIEQIGPVQLTPAGSSLMSGDATYKFGYAAADYCKKVAGAAILTTPLKGKQYWEIKITTLPSGNYPSGYTLTSTGNAFATSSEVGLTLNITPAIPGNWASLDANLGNMIPYVFTSQISSSVWQVSWPTDIDTWGTPAIGVVPAYYLPDDLRTASPTDQPKHYLDMTRTPGLDKMVADITTQNLRARSILAYSTAAAIGTGGGYVTLPGVWEIKMIAHSGNAGSFGDMRAWYAALVAWSAGGGTGTKPTNPPPDTGFPKKGWRVLGYDNYVRTGPTGYTPAQPTTMTWRAGDAMGGAGYYAYMFETFTNEPFDASSLGPDDIHGTSVGYGYSGWWPGGSVEWSLPYGSANAGHFFCVHDGDVFSLPTYLLNTTVEIYNSSSMSHGVAVTGLVNCMIANGDGIVITHGGGSKTISSMDYDRLLVAFPNLADFTMDAAAFTDLGTVRYTPGITYYDPTGGAGTGAHMVSAVGEFFPSFSKSVTVASPAGADVVPDAPKAMQRLVDPGKHMPAYIGRPDLLPERPSSWTTASMGDGATTDLHVSDGKVGLFTGVDLGKLGEGDVVMVATDADNGYVWFGKNGKWYIPDPSGGGDICTQVSASDTNQQHGPGAQTPDGWAAVMDGAKKSASYDRGAPHAPYYYPAVGYRVGPFDAEIIYDRGKLKYAPPGGFEVYGQTKISYGP